MTYKIQTMAYQADWPWNLKHDATTLTNWSLGCNGGYFSLFLDNQEK